MRGLTLGGIGVGGITAVGGFTLAFACASTFAFKTASLQALRTGSLGVDAAAMHQCPDEVPRELNAKMVLHETPHSV